MKVEVGVLHSPSLILCMMSVDIKSNIETNLSLFVTASPSFSVSLHLFDCLTIFWIVAIILTIFFVNISFLFCFSPDKDTYVEISQYVLYL